MTEPMPTVATLLATTSALGLHDLAAIMAFLAIREGLAAPEDG